MFAVIQTGGKQYRVEPGMRIRLEKIKPPQNGEVVFDSVLMFNSGEKTQVGNPLLPNVQVKGNVIGEGKGKKLIVFKYRRRKRTARKKGHRQPYHEVEITAIEQK